MVRRSRRLAGLPPVELHEEEQKEEYITEDLGKNGLIYTDAVRGEYVWLFVTIIFFLLPLYLFLGTS
jgi:hypothetical protein